MKNGKRILVLVAVTGLLMAGVLASVGQAETVSMLHTYTSGMAPANVLADVIEQYETRNPGVKIKEIAMDQQVYEDGGLLTALQGGSPPDIYHIIGQWELLELVRDGYGRDITDLCEDWFTAYFWPFTWSHVMKDNRIYGIPHRVSICPLMWYNKSYFEEYGLDKPQTWPEFVNVAETLKENGVTPMLFGNAQLWMFGNFSGSVCAMVAGRELHEKVLDLEPGTSFDNPAYVRAFTLLAELGEKSFVNPDMNSLKWTPSTMSWFQGVGAMHPNGTWVATLAEEGAPEDFRYGAFALPLPAGSQGNQYIQGQVEHYMVNENTAVAEEAVDFLKVFSHPINQAEMIHAGNLAPEEQAYFLAGTIDPTLNMIKETLVGVGDFVGVPDEYHSVEVADTFYQGAAAVVAGEKAPQEALRWIDERLEPARTR